MSKKVALIVLVSILVTILILNVVLCCTVPGPGIAMIAGELLGVSACAFYGYYKSRSTMINE